MQIHDMSFYSLWEGKINLRKGGSGIIMGHWLIEHDRKEHFSFSRFFLGTQW